MTEARGVLLVYDGECPACSFYSDLARIRSTIGELKLIDAREPGPTMEKITAAGIDIDQGMVLIVGSEMYCGSDALHMLSMLSSRSGIFNRMTYRVFGSKKISWLLYPVLRSVRNLLLKILRRTKINNLDICGNDRF